MKFLLAGGAVCGLLAVLLGAFAAHGLKTRLDESMLAVFQTGAQYQMYHSLAILLVAILYRQTPQPLFIWAGSAMFFGILLFSGSLYALALSGMRGLGAITPLGGVCFILGWGLLVIAALRQTGGSH